MSSVRNLGEDLYRIRLDRPDDWPETVGEPKNVYVAAGGSPALINAGHPTQHGQLVEGLEEIGLRVGEIERAVCTSWAVDVAGGVEHLSEADCFLASPDMRAPRDYEARLQRQRSELRELGTEVAGAREVDGAARDRLDAFISAYYPAATSELDFIPIRGGHEIRAGHLRLEVIEAPGPSPGHVCLHAVDEELLFSGDVATSGLPASLDDVRSYVVTLERLVDFEVDRLLPNRGDVRRRASWTLECSLRFVDNYISNAPAALFEEPTLLEFAQRDMGYWPEDFAEAILKLRTYRLLMDELVRAEMIEAEGEGLARRYGTDVDDPREPLRPE